MSWLCFKNLHQTLFRVHVKLSWSLQPWLTGNVATNWENCKWKKCTACLWRLKKQQTTYKQSHRVSSLQAKARWETKQPSKQAHTNNIKQIQAHKGVCREWKENFFAVQCCCFGDNRDFHEEWEIKMPWKCEKLFAYR